MPTDNPNDASNKRIASKDELLQVMFWLRGEGISKDVAAKDLTRWMTLDSMEIHSLLVELAEAKLVEPVLVDAPEAAETRFRLTEVGGKEGGRRFADEFSELTKPGHYECSDPNCDCRRSGNPADCVHQH